MSKIYRIKTTPGKDQNLTVNINQDFEEIELLSLKIRQEDVYPIGCSDYGVIAGRVFVNGGYGLPKAKVSVFIPLKPEDENNPVLTSYYPYKTLQDVNEDGYRYNLLPYTPSYQGHAATGTFPTREDVLKDPVAAELFEKYYKYTVTTNDSGDYMIYGVPLGTHTIVLNVDLSDIGEFSMTPQDLIRIGRGTESQFNGSFFKSSNNFNELPQIVYETKIVQVNAFWGQADTCQVGITRTDFDLSNSQSNITIQPTAVFMGSIFSADVTKKIKRKCKVKSKLGQLCQLTTGPGQIVAIRQTIDIDDNGLPILEKYDLPQSGKLIDADGTWLVEVPMNLDYVYTNENGEQVLSDDPKLGVPTNGKYRFKIKWQQPSGLNEENRRGYFLVPNIREHGWTSSDEDPLLYSTETFTIQTNDAVINISGQSGYVYRIKSKTNVTDYVVELDGSPYVGNKEDIVLNSNAVISITPTYEDPDATATWVFEKIPLAKYSLERSYAFSLSWNDYNNPQEAIDCIDTFYFMKYNKVYTVSQLLDRYTSRKFTWNTLQIKNINTDDCEESVNKMPVNDVQYRFVPIFVFFNFMLTLMKFVLKSIVIPMHLLAFLWPVIYYILLIVWFVQIELWVFCKAINKIKSWIGWSQNDCGEKPKRPNFKDNWFRNIKLPLLLYTEDGCETCDCKDSQIDLSGNDTSSTLQQNVVILQSTQNSSPLADFNSADSYTSSKAEIPQIWQGPTPYTQTQDYCTADACVVMFSNSLGIAAKLDLFNGKDKYFDNTGVNGGYGRNQVKRTICPEQNASKYHFDNTIVLFVDDAEAGNFTPGQLISFNSPDFSSDINFTGGTENSGATKAITGTPMSNNSQWTISYAQPNNPNVSTTVTYNINFTSETKNYMFAPSDVEYFEVLTGITVANFTALTENNININSNFLNFTTKPDLLNRYLLTISKFYYRAVGNDFMCGGNNCDDCVGDYWGITVGLPDTASTPNRYWASQQFQNLAATNVIILQRGVDPNSPSVKQEIDLSRIFGWEDNYGQHPELVISGEYRLNIPIQPGLKLPRHNEFTNNGTQDNGGNGYIFFPGTIDFSATFSSYTTSLPYYYSNLNGSSSPKNIGNGSNNNILVLPSTNPNFYMSDCCDGAYIGWCNIDFITGDNKYYGYSQNEYTEGGYEIKLIKSETDNNGDQIDCSGAGTGDSPVIHAYSYNNTVTSGIYPIQQTFNMTDPSRLVMRTDRLPSSTSIATGGTIYLMHQNPGFQISVISADGNAQNVGGQPEVYTFTEIDTGSTPSQYSNVIESLSDCSKAVPLECYVVNPDNTVSIKPCDESDGTCCGKNYSLGGFRSWFNYGSGCYNLVSFPIISIVKDFALITEFIQRLKLNMALCFDVFSHTFGNAWMNGSLYAFPFQMITFYDNQNKPYYNYCKEVMYFHDPTNNFYYRSSPYNENTGKFIGRKSNEKAGDNGNRKQLGFPTTMMDLGPKVSYLQEIVYSDDYDGYIVDQLDSTSFKDVTDLINIMILSRFVNENFLGLFLPGLSGDRDPSVAGFFRNMRWNPSTNILFPGTIDGDYSQMVAVNSEFGIAEFSPESYDINTAVKVMRDNSNRAYFEVFFSGNNQTRDYITPRRKIWNQNASTSPLPSDFGYISTFSQVVPFYRWNFKTEASNTIFGNQNNNWNTNESDFFQYKYQSLDRISPASQSVIVGSTNTKYWKGFIYGVDNNGNETDVIPSGFENQRQVNNPFFFYFGLKKGASAFDKFRTKYINETEIL